MVEVSSKKPGFVELRYNDVGPYAGRQLVLHDLDQNGADRSLMCSLRHLLFIFKEDISLLTCEK